MRLYVILLFMLIMSSCVKQKVDHRSHLKVLEDSVRQLDTIIDLRYVGFMCDTPTYVLNEIIVTPKCFKIDSEVSKDLIEEIATLIGCDINDVAAKMGEIMDADEGIIFDEVDVVWLISTYKLEA